MSRIPAAIRDKIARQLNRTGHSAFLKNAFWATTSAIFLRAQVVIVSLVIAHFLSVEDFGRLGLLRSAILSFSVFGSLSVGLAATKYISIKLVEDKAQVFPIVRFANKLTLFSSLLTSIILFFSAQIVTEKTLHDPSLAGLARLSAVVVFLNSLLATQTGVLNGFQAFRHLAFRNLIITAAGIILQVSGTLFFGMKGFLYGMIVMTLLQMLMYQLAIRSTLKAEQCSRDSKLDSPLKRDFIQFCIPAFMGSILVTPVSWFCSSMLASYAGYQQMAYFEVANNWRTILIFIPLTISQVILPMISSQHDKKHLKASFLFNIRLTLLITTISVAVLIICSKFVLNAYGHQYEEGRISFIILLSSVILIASSNVAGQFMAAKMKMWYGFVLNLFWAVFIIALTYFFVRHKGLGAAGLSWAYVMSYLIHLSVSLIIVILFLSRQDSQKIKEKLSR